MFANVSSSSSHFWSGPASPLFVVSFTSDFANSKPLLSFNLMLEPSFRTAPRVSPTAGSIFSSFSSTTSSGATSTVSFTDALMPLLSTEAYVRSEPLEIVISSDSTVTFACLPLEVLSITEVRSKARTVPLCSLPLMVTSTSSVSVYFRDVTLTSSLLSYTSNVVSFTPSETFLYCVLSPLIPIVRSPLSAIALPDL